MWEGTCELLRWKHFFFLGRKGATRQRVTWHVYFTHVKRKGRQQKTDMGQQFDCVRKETDSTGNRRENVRVNQTAQSRLRWHSHETVSTTNPFLCVGDASCAAVKKKKQWQNERDNKKKRRRKKGQRSLVTQVERNHHQKLWYGRKPKKCCSTAAVHADI